MSTGIEVTVGGIYGEFAPPQPFVPNPHEAALQDLAANQRTAVQQWAQGMAGAPRETIHVQPLSSHNVLGLVRIGTDVQTGEPLLFSPESNVAIGDPELLTPIAANLDRAKVLATAAKGATLNAVEAKNAESKARYVAQQAEAERQRSLEQERVVAVRIMTNLMTRALGSIRPPLLRLTAYCGGDPKAFSGFASLSEAGLYDAVPEGELASRLTALAKEVHRRHNNELHGFPSLRAMIELADVDPPVPIELLSIAAGPELSAEDITALNYILNHGAAVGVYAIHHGVPISVSPGQRIVLYGNSGAQTEALGYESFALDPPLAKRSIVAIAQAVAAQAAGASLGKERPSAEAIPNARQLEDYLAQLPAARYGRSLAAGRHNVYHASAVMSEHAAQLPVLTQENLLDEVWPSMATYAALMTGLAAGEKAAINRLKSILGAKNTASELDQVAAWAAMTLLDETPGFSFKWLKFNFSKPNFRGRPPLDVAVPLVGITQQHNQSLLGEMEAHIAPLLSPDPPAWAFDVVAREVLRSGRQRQDALRAFCSDLEHRFDVQLQDETGTIIDKDLVRRLAHYRSLELNGFAEATPELRTALTRRGEQQGLPTDPEGLPQSARNLHNSWVMSIAEIGRWVGVKERAGRAMTALAAAVLPGPKLAPAKPGNAVPAADIGEALPVNES